MCVSMHVCWRLNVVYMKLWLQTDGLHIHCASCLFIWKKSGPGQTAEVAEGEKGKEVGGGDADRSQWQVPSCLEQLKPTSAACPVLADLKAVSAETEGAVPGHDAAIAASQLVAGWQQLCGGTTRRKEGKYLRRSEERPWKPRRNGKWLFDLGNYIWFSLLLLPIQLHSYHYAQGGNFQLTSTHFCVNAI